MRNPKLFTIVLAVALMLSNIACACAMANVPGESSNSSEIAHHHAGNDAPSVSMPCAHLDCDGCDEFQDTCLALDYTVVSAERDSRLATLPQTDSDGADLDLIFTGLDPPWHPRFVQLLPPLDSAFAVYLTDTPVNRKDQLTE